MELISVIVPVYKVEKYLTRCIESILNQTYKNIEIILVDDGSPDLCPKMCDDFAEKYDNIKVIHKANGGLSSARNAGIEICKGTYVSFIDSDDFIDRLFLERLITLAKKYKADLVMLKYQEVSTDKMLSRIKVLNEKVYKGKAIEKAFLNLKIDSVCVGLYKKDVVDRHRFISGKTSEDIPFNFEVFRDISTFVFSPEPRYYYFYNPESISNGSLDKNMFNYLYYRKEIYEHYLKENSDLVVSAEALYARAAFGLQTRMALYGISENLDEDECRKIFAQVFKDHKKSFYADKNISILRKIVSIVVFNFYDILKFVRKIKG